MRQKCVRNAPKLRQKRVRNARNTFGGEYLLDDTERCGPRPSGLAGLERPHAPDLRWAKSRDSYRRIASESYRCDSNR